MNKQEALKRVQDAIEQCTVQDSHHCAVVVIVNEKEHTVRVYGLNIDETEVPSLLIEAAGEVGDKFLEDMKRRTLQ